MTAWALLMISASGLIAIALLVHVIGFVGAVVTLRGRAVGRAAVKIAVLTAVATVIALSIADAPGLFLPT